jgi:hypothetical protein
MVERGDGKDGVVWISLGAVGRAVCSLLAEDEADFHFHFHFHRSVMNAYSQ